MVEIPYCEKNENGSKHFIKKFEAFTNHRYRIAIKWITRKVISLFKVKSRNLNSSCVIHRSKCSCGKEYIGVTERKVEKRWSEYNNPIEKTDPARHFSSNTSNLFAFVWGAFSKRQMNTLELGSFFYYNSKTIIEWTSEVEYFAPFSKRRHMRGFFNDFNNLLLYFLLIL